MIPVSQSHDYFSSFRQSLAQLGFASSEEAFHQTIEKMNVSGQLSPAGQAIAQAVSLWIAENENQLNEKDLSSLLLLKNRLKAFLHLSAGDPSIYKIQQICHQMLKQPASEELLQIVKETFPDSDSDEQFYICHALAKHSGVVQSEILNLMKERPQDKRSSFFFELEFLVNSISNANQQMAIIQAIKGIPPEEKASVVESVFPLIQGVTDGYELSAIIKAIREFSSEERASVVEMVVPLVKDIPNGNHRAAILKAIREILPEERASVVEVVFPLIQGLGFQLIFILKAIREIPPEERASVVEMVVPWIQGVTNGSERLAILQIMQEIAQEQRASFFTMTSSLIEDIPPKERLSILKLIVEIPQDQRDKALEVAKVLFPDFSIHQKIIFLEALPYFALYSWNALIKMIRELPKILDHLPKTPYMIQIALQSSEELREIMYPYLIGRLQSLTSREEARRFAKFIWDNQDKFLIYEEHPLAQEALSILILTKQTNDPKNPYIIYQRLEEEVKSPFPAIGWPAEEVAGEHVTFHLPAFQVNKLSQERVTFDQLPAISPQDLQGLFEALEKRLESLGDKRQEVEDYIANACQASFSFLKTNYVKDASIQHLLSVKGNAGEIAPIEVAHFLKIIQFIMDQPNAIPAGELLSPREDVLLKMSASIQNCKYGKEEGIEKAYKFLPPQYHYPVEKKQTIKPKLEKGMAYLDALVTSLSPDPSELLTSDSALLQELTNAHPIGQLAHQSRYLKNLIGPKIGLQPHVKFDVYTNTLYNDLVNKETSKVLAIFYKHYLPFGPQKLVQTLVERVNQETDREKKLNLFKSLNKFLGKRNLSGIWEYNDDTDQYMLTEAGAREIWMAAGYLKPSPSVNVNPSH